MLGQKFYSKIASNKWWDKYKDEKNVLIEDMDKNHEYMGFNLKIWSDKYAYPVEIKYGGTLMRPQVIIVTSNYSIQECFPDPSIHLPLLERFKVIHKTQRWNATVNTVLMPTADTSSEDETDNVHPCAKPFKKVFKTKSLKKKPRKYDKPLKKPALYRQDATGSIVPNKQKQPLVSLALQEAKAIAAEEDSASGIDVINIDDSNEEDSTEAFITSMGKCNYCNILLPYCKCMESEDDTIYCNYCSHPENDCQCFESQKDKDDPDYIYNGNDEFGSDEFSQDLLDL